MKPDQRAVEETIAEKQPVYFESKQPVRWLTPKEMLGGAYNEFFGGLFSKYADNRDRIDLLREPVYHARALDQNGDGPLIRPLPWHTEDGHGTFVFDYVADVGDGFGATYAIADGLAQPALTVNPSDDDPPGTGDGSETTLARGDLLIFGGDQVYPIADRREYRDRTVGPYALAFRGVEDGPSEDRPLFAIPGNHDWYDGLASFLDIFTVPRPAADHAGQPGPGGAWARHQTRSYFAIDLAHDWWLWGVDVGLDGSGRISEEQIDYFIEARNLLGEDGRIILCVSEPAWLKRTETKINREPDAWDQLVDFLWTVFEDDPWPRVRLVLTGDKHYYARHEEPSDVGRAERPTLLTAGGGGAYLSSTLDAHDEVELNLDPLDSDTWPSGLTGFRAARRWPTKQASTRLGIQGLATVPLRNPAFNAMMSVIYGLWAFFAVSGWRYPAFAAAESSNTTLNELAAGSLGSAFRRAILGPLVTFPGFVFALVLLGGLGLYTFANFRRVKWWIVPFGLLHIGLHLIALPTSVILAAKMSWVSGSAPDVRWWWVLIFLIGGLVLLALPELWSWFWFRVADFRQLLYFGPALVALIVLVVAGRENPETGGITVVVAAAVIGGMLGTLSFVFYLVVGQLRGVGLNELFVGIRHTGYKHFLRVEVERDEVTVNVVGIRRTIPRRVELVDDRRPHLTVPPKAAEATGELARFLLPSEPELVDRFSVGR